MTDYLLSNIHMKYCMIQLQHRTPLAHKQKWKTDVPRPGQQSGARTPVTCFIITSASQDEQNCAHVETHFVFLCIIHLSSASKQTLFKPLTISSDLGDVFLQQNISLWSICRGWPTWNSFHTMYDCPYVTSLGPSQCV